MERGADCSPSHPTLALGTANGGGSWLVAWRTEASAEICVVYGQDIKKEGVCTRPTEVHEGHLA